MFTPTYSKDLKDDVHTSILDQLDHKFKQKVDSGWFELWHKDRIYLVLPLDNLGAGVLAHREKVVEYYKNLGWGDASIGTSEEDGERAGLVMVTLYV